MLASGDPLLSPSGGCCERCAVDYCHRFHQCQTCRSSRLARRATRAHRTGNAEQGRSLLVMGAVAQRQLKVVIWMMSKARTGCLPARVNNGLPHRPPRRQKHPRHWLTLSAALAALRPRHTNWADTVQEAKSWLSSALAQADTLEVGHGIGPVHHFHACGEHHDSRFLLRSSFSLWH